MIGIIGLGVSRLQLTSQAVSRRRFVDTLQDARSSRTCSERPVKSGSDELRALVPANGVLIVRTPDRGPIRTMTSGRSATVTQRYASRRYRATYPGEGQTEMGLNKHDEVVADVAFSLPQPFRIHCWRDGVVACAIPDRFRVLATGERQLVDVKWDWAGFRKPDAAKHSAILAMAAEQLGITHVKWVNRHLGNNTFRANVDLIQLYRFNPVTFREEQIARRLLADGPVAMADLCHAMNLDYARGLGVTCAMMVLRAVAIDLETPIGPDSRICAAPAIDKSLLTLRL